VAKTAFTSNAAIDAVDGADLKGSSTTKQIGISKMADHVSIAATVTSGAIATNLRPWSVPKASERVARKMANWPIIPWPNPLRAPTPAIKTTPPSPADTPANRVSVMGSCRVQARVRRHTNKGEVELKMAANALSVIFCPHVVRV
jgi:hypothetical protein